MKKSNCYTLEHRYVELARKAVHIIPTEEEMIEFESLTEQLGIEPCDNCKGIGGFEVPSMMSGWEFYHCNTCKGHGLKNATTYIHENLKEIN